MSTVIVTEQKPENETEEESSSTTTILIIVFVSIIFFIFIILAFYWFFRKPTPTDEQVNIVSCAPCASCPVCPAPIVCEENSIGNLIATGTLGRKNHQLPTKRQNNSITQSFDLVTPENGIGVVSIPLGINPNFNFTVSISVANGLLCGTRSIFLPNDSEGPIRFNAEEQGGNLLVRFFRGTIPQLPVLLTITMFFEESIGITEEQNFRPTDFRANLNVGANVRARTPKRTPYRGYNRR